MEMPEYLFGNNSCSSTERINCIKAISVIKNMKECQEKKTLMDYLKKVVNGGEKYSEIKFCNLIKEYQLLFPETSVGYEKLEKLNNMN